MRKILLTIIGATCILALSYGSTALHFFQGQKVQLNSNVVYADEFDPAGEMNVGGNNQVNELDPAGEMNTGGNNQTGGGGQNQMGGEGQNQNSGNGQNQNSGPGTPNVNVTLPNPLLSKYDTLCKVLEAIISMITQIGALIAVILIIWTGFNFVLARGNEAKLKNAKNMFFTTIVGTAVLLGASVIAQIVVKTVFSITNKGNSGICNI